MPETALFTAFTEVKPEWIDFNGHMNMGYYLVAFDHIATDQFYNSMNIGIAHKQALGMTTFTLGANIDFIREVLAGDKLRLTSQLADYDHKRLHYIHRMYHADKGYLAATNECLGMYIDLETRRSASFNDEQMARFEQELERGKRVSLAEEFGRKLGIRR
ncbi:MAG: thioesterase family protein [Halioglobus sp.]|nr:thioesterase family protein [Halioglobus sp.]